jgi:hypothetical protein
MNDITFSEMKALPPSDSKSKLIIVLLVLDFISLLLLILLLFTCPGTPTKGLSGSQDSDKERGSSGGGGGGGDRQFTVFVSEKQARLVSLPSQTCLYKQQICETSFVIKAEITTVKGREIGKCETEWNPKRKI